MTTLCRLPLRLLRQGLPVGTRSRRTRARGFAILALLGCSVAAPLAAQSGCVATLQRRSGISGAVPYCQGRVSHPVFARLDPNCAPLNSNGTYSEARLYGTASGNVMLATRGLVRAPAFDGFEYITGANVTATGDIRYFGPAASLTLTLEVRGIHTQNLVSTFAGYQVKCGPSAAVSFSLQPFGVPHTYTLTRTFPVTNGSSFDLVCNAAASTSGANSGTPRHVDWSLTATVIHASIDVPGQPFQLRSNALPLRYWPPVAIASVTPFGQGCANAAGAPVTSASELPRVGNPNFAVEVSTAPGASTLLALGFVPVTPFDLGNGCFLLTSSDVVLVQTANPGPVSFPLPIPASAGLLDAVLDVQGASLDAPTLTLASSAALRLVLGY